MKTMSNTAPSLARLRQATSQSASTMRAAEHFRRSRLVRIHRAAEEDESTRTADAAPLDKASIPSAPLPENRSKTVSPPSRARLEKSASLARSEVGLVPLPGGTEILRPPHSPLITLSIVRPRFGPTEARLERLAAAPEATRTLEPPTQETRQAFPQRCCEQAQADQCRLAAARP